MREPPRVLIVDDNPANLEILEARLARQGYEIITRTVTQPCSPRGRTRPT